MTTLLRATAPFLCFLSLAVAPMAAASQVTVTVTSIGDAVADVYLALAADDQPWTNPVHETTAPAGAATWQVAAGTWRVIAIARGFSTAMSDAFTLSESEHRQVRLDLERLTRTDGFVTDESGHPIAGAIVTRSDVSAPELSVLGERHRRANTTATTSSNGAFTVPVPPERTQLLIVEAHGYAPVVIDAARITAPPANVIALSTGASLRVNWSSDPGERPRKVSLLPVDVALPTGLTRERAASIWTRPLADARWESLPSGTYQLVLRAGTAATDERAPSSLADVVLGPGDDRTLRVVLPPWQPPVSDAVREIRVLVSGASPDERLRVSEWRDGRFTELQPELESVAGGVLVKARVRCAAKTMLVVESKTNIGSVALDKCDETQRLSLAPRATLIAQVTAPRGGAVPAGGVLRVSGCSTEPATAAIPFALRASHVEAATIAGCREAALHMSGFVPLKLQGASTDAGATRNLGTLTLVRGAAVALRVRSARDAEPQAGVRVTAVRAGDLAAARRDLDLDRIALATATTDAAGWTRMANLPEEHVVFVLQAPARAYPQVSEPYELEGGQETLMDDLLLEVPSSVFVTVSLPDALESAVELDGVELYASGHSHWPALVPLRGLLSPTGAVVEDVPPGTWRVHATGRLKNGFVIRAAETTVEVLPGVDANVTLNITDRLYRGRVTRGGEPVSGVLNLKPEERGGGRRAAVAPVAADGTFQVLLEGDGLYSVRFQEYSTGGGVMLDRWIAFENPEKQIEIELPEGRITGRVVDSTGAPVANVLVGGTQQMTTPTGSIFTRNTADGRFVLESVAAGNWELVAESDAGRSEALVVGFEEGQLDGVTLLLEPISTIRVRATDVTGGPVPGTFIAAAFPGPRGPRTDVGLTDAQGLATFRLRRAEQATPVNLSVVTADIRLSCALRRLDTDQTIIVPQATGELRLTGREWRLREGVRNWLVSSAGCAVPFIGTRDERESDGGSAKVFPRLAAGTWSLVETHDAEQYEAIMTGRGARLQPIKTFTVQPGRTTKVLLPGGSER
jgi:Carboxypeptidase regulatory-like domain